MASRWLSPPQQSQPLRIHQDTTDFFAVDYGDVLVLGERPYLIRHNAKEGRFGVDDEVKFWVKRAIDLEDGSAKIIKLVFHEKFTAHIGAIQFECFRSPRKEARILERVADHPNFMNGFSREDEQGNIVRVLDFIHGPSIYSFVEGLDMDHQAYFSDQFPEILQSFVECIQAIRFLHDQGEKHGDIRRDHILIDRHDGRYRWIDFDFNYRHRENIFGYDLFGLGNILIYLVGKGDVTLHELKRRNSKLLDGLTRADLNIVFHNRVANLQKIYPYIPNELNRILMHFAQETHVFYENTGQLLEDLGAFQASA